MNRKQYIKHINRLRDENELLRHVMAEERKIYHKHMFDWQLARRRFREKVKGKVSLMIEYALVMTDRNYPYL